jgi:hypothetical protein
MMTAISKHIIKKNNNERLTRICAAMCITVFLYSSVFLFSKIDSLPLVGKTTAKTVCFIPPDLDKNTEINAFIKYNNPRLFFFRDTVVISDSVPWVGGRHLIKSFLATCPDSITIDNFNWHRDTPRLNGEFTCVRDPGKFLPDAHFGSLSAFDPENIQSPPPTAKPAEYPVVFDSYGKIVKDIIPRIRGLDSSKAVSETVFEFILRGDERIPDCRVVKSSSVSELDKAALQKISAFAVKYASKWNLDKIYFTIYWKEFKKQ